VKHSFDNVSDLKSDFIREIYIHSASSS